MQVSAFVAGVFGELDGREGERVSEGGRRIGNGVRAI